MLLIDLWALFQQYQVLFLALKIDGIRKTLHKDFENFVKMMSPETFRQIAH